MTTIFRLPVFTLLGLLVTSTSVLALPNYTITNLGSLGGSASEAYGINNLGQVVGASRAVVGGQYQAFVWQSGTMNSLGFQGVARVINNNGEIVGETGTRGGWSGPQTPDGRAFYWNNNAYGTYTDLGTLRTGNGGNAGAFDINDAGQISGFAFTNNLGTPATYSQYTRGFIADKNTNGSYVMTDLGCANPAYPDCYSRAHGINQEGDMTGRASVTLFGDTDPLTNNSKTFVYWDENLQKTTMSPGSNSLVVSTGEDINNAGISVGTWTNGVNRYGAIWTVAGGVASEIQLLAQNGIDPQWNMAINDSGLVVGFDVFKNTSNGEKAYMFDVNNLSSLTSLEDLVIGGLISNGWQSLTVANDINDLGQIVGYGIDSAGNTSAFIMTPTAVPVPAAAWLMGSGLMGLFGLSRRRQKA